MYKEAALKNIVYLLDMTLDITLRLSRNRKVMATIVLRSSDVK